MQVIRLTMMALALVAPALADAQERPARVTRQQNEAQRREQSEARSYERGTRAINAQQWDRAIEAFAEVAALAGERSPGALYWKAYAQNRIGQGAEALSTLAEFRSKFDTSTWARDARALEVEIRQAAGQPVGPEVQADEELKLLALQGLASADPTRAVPMLESILKGTQSPKLKDRALFVLAQSNTDAARTLLLAVAKGDANPDLQLRAIHYLGVNGGAATRAALGDLYSSLTDVQARRAVLRSLMIAGDRARILAVASSEQNANLRQEAVRQLGVMGGQSELAELYRKETDVEVKKQILQAMFVGGDATQLIELATTEKTKELRLTAIRNLGVMGSTKTGEALVSVYRGDSDGEVRSAVIQGLFVQNNAKALVELARQETDAALKQRIVRQLSLMTKSKEAMDYLMEILGK